MAKGYVMNLVEEIKKRTKLSDNDIICIYQYGSRVYQNFNSSSDYDFIVIVKNKVEDQFSDRLINVNFYDIIGHQHRIDEHEISALECQFLSSEFILKEDHRFNFKLDLSKLRKAISAKSSNSWVKAKKKLTVIQDYDLNIGRKSLFHAFRIIDFGIQIAKNSKIINYSSCNDLFYEIQFLAEWDEMFEKYKKSYNEICSKFKLVAPK